MFERIMKLIRKVIKKEDQTLKSKDAAKERLHLVLMQDRANVSADFLDLMKQEIIEVIKKYIDIDEGAMDVRLTNKENSDGTNGAPALYANIPIINIKDETRQNAKVEVKETESEEIITKEDNVNTEKNTEENKTEIIDKTEITEKNEEENRIEEKREEIKIEKAPENKEPQKQNFKKKHKNKKYKK